MTDKKGIIFDLDGTLWDACAPMAEAWNACLREKYPKLAAAGMPATEEIMRQNCGRTIDQFADILLGSVEEEERYAVNSACWDHVVRHISACGGRPYPEMRKTLEALRDVYHLHLYIVSNGQAGYIQDFMRLTGTGELFEDTEDFGTTRLGKAQNIRLVVERNGLGHAVYVGDTVMDYRSAKEAGLPFVHAAYGFGEVPEPDARIRSLPELAGRDFLAGLGLTAG